MIVQIYRKRMNSLSSPWLSPQQKLKKLILNLGACVLFLYERTKNKNVTTCLIFCSVIPSLLTWTNLVSRRSICIRMSSQASHMQVRDRCRYCSSVEMWVNLRAILVTSGRQSDSSPVSSCRTRKVLSELKGTKSKTAKKFSPDSNRSLGHCQPTWPLWWWTETSSHSTDSGCGTFLQPVGLKCTISELEILHLYLILKKKNLLYSCYSSNLVHPVGIKLHRTNVSSKYKCV